MLSYAHKSHWLPVTYQCPYLKSTHVASGEPRMFPCLGWTDHVKITHVMGVTQLKCFINRDLVCEEDGGGHLGTSKTNPKPHALNTRHCIDFSTIPFHALGPRCHMRHWGSREACKELTVSQGTENNNKKMSSQYAK